jgi:hypothetical protein
MYTTEFMLSEIRDKLLGSTIVDVCADEEGFFGFVVEDKTGLKRQVFVSSDPEGNDVGWLNIGMSN